MLKHPFEQELHAALKQYYYLVKKDYLNKLNCANISMSCNDDEDEILLFRIQSFFSSAIYSFFTYVFNALASQQTTIAFILDKHNETFFFYIGLRISGASTVSSEILTQGFSATFSPSPLVAFTKEESANLLSVFFAPDNFKAVTNAIVIPNNTSTEHTPLLQKFTKLFSKEDYTAIFLATPVSPCKTEELIDELVSLYTILSQFTQANHNLFKGIAHNSSCTSTTNSSESCGKNCTHTDNENCGSSTAGYTNLSPSTTVPIGNSTRSVNVSMTFNQAYGSNHSSSSSEAKGENSSNTQGSSQSNLKATNITDNNTLIYIKQNKAVSDALSALTTLIARFSSAETNSLFYFSAFFLSPLMSTSIRAGYTYAGLAKDAVLNLEATAITTWSSDDTAFKPLLASLQQLRLPSFILPHSSRPSKTFKGDAIITSTELLNTFYFPFSSP